LSILVAQTDVSGIWAAPRRTRITTYLAGIAVDLLIAASYGRLPGGEAAGLETLIAPAGNETRPVTPERESEVKRMEDIEIRELDRVETTVVYDM
jgi:hypothetical protein